MNPRHQFLCWSFNWPLICNPFAPRISTLLKRIGVLEGKDGEGITHSYHLPWLTIIQATITNHCKTVMDHYKPPFSFNEWTCIEPIHWNWPLKLTMLHSPMNTQPVKWTTSEPFNSPRLVTTPWRSGRGSSPRSMIIGLAWRHRESFTYQELLVLATDHGSLLLMAVQQLTIGLILFGDNSSPATQLCLPPAVVVGNQATLANE